MNTITTTIGTVHNNTLAEAIADASRTSKGRVNADRVGKATYKELRRVVDSMRLPAYECLRIDKDAQIHDGTSIRSAVPIWAAASGNCWPTSGPSTVLPWT